MKLGGYEWIILDSTIGLITTKGIVTELPFDEGNSNNWDKSTIKNWLNNEFLTTFTKEELDKIDGEIRLLTEEEILEMKYKNVSIGKNYWLMTPYSGDSTGVRRVTFIGAVYNLSASSTYGVRPVLALNKLCDNYKSIVVGIIEEEIYIDYAGSFTKEEIENIKNKL